MRIRASILLVTALLCLSSSAFPRDHLGAAAVLALKDGRMLTGELYAIKTDAVIVVDSQGRSVTVAVADIRRIDLKKRIGKSVRTGAILGFGAGAVLGIKAAAIDDHGTVGLGGYAAAAALVGLVGAVPGALAGWAVAGPNRDKTFVIEGLSGEPLQKVLSKLTKYARAPALR